mmetsp:Transcript_45844/g.146225  ORF Transcript_45844/g.146225 Transcript_45844/m.146225 type:complete len:95 (+) Transcript_45844:274-558(+)
MLPASQRQMHEVGDALGSERVRAINAKDHVIADIEFWSRFVRPGGSVAGHDYCFGNTGVVEGVHKVLPKGCTLHLAPNAVYWCLRAPDSSGISC